MKFGYLKRGQSTKEQEAVLDIATMHLRKQGIGYPGEMAYCLVGEQ